MRKATAVLGLLVSGVLCLGARYSAGNVSNFDFDPISPLFSITLDVIDGVTHGSDDLIGGILDAHFNNVTQPTSEESLEKGILEVSDATPSERVGKKITLCHKGKKTISVNASAVSGHLKHGDTLNACLPGSPQDDQYTDDVYDGNNVSPGKVTMCHKGKKTISVGASAVSAHLNHGDTLAVCP